MNLGQRLLVKAIEIVSLPIWVAVWVWRNRALRSAIIYAISLAILINHFFGTEALYNVAATVFQVVSAIGFMAIQFIGLFWFLSRTKVIESLPGEVGNVAFENDYYGSEHIVSLVRHWTELLTTGRGKLEAMGAKPLSGLLLFGAPGTGKTLLARCLASDAESAFIGMSGSDFTCVSGDALVTTKWGLKRADEIRPHDIVWTGWNWKEVLAWKLQGKREGYRVTTRAGYNIDLSPTHPLWVFKWRKNIDPSWQAKLRRTGESSSWVDAQDLSVGDWVALSPEETLGKYTMNPLDAYILGLYIAEGWVPRGYKERNYEFLIANGNERVQKVVTLWATQRGHPHSINRDRTKVRLGRSGVDWLLNYVVPEQTARYKEIPSVILESDTRTKAAFLSGLFDGDGSAEPVWGLVTYATASKALANQVHVLLGTLGIASTLRSYKTASSFVPGSQMYGITMSGKWTARFQELTTCLRLKKVKPKIDNRRARLKYAEDGFVYDPIVAVESIAAEFYDIEVEGDHAFCANQFVTENSMFLGVGVLKVRGMFSKSRKWAKMYGTCILWIDEIDAIGGNRGGVQGDPRNQPGQGGMAGGLFGGMGGLGVMSRLLVEMDGITEVSLRDRIQNNMRAALGLHPIDQGTVLVMAGTNRPDTMDTALLRPGRFDKRIEVALPDKGSRKAIINGYLGKVMSYEEMDIDYLVSITNGVSPATLASVIEKDAPRIAISEGRDHISQADIEDALQENLLGLENPISDLDPEQRRQIATHEAGHTVTAYFLRPHQKIARVSIVRRSLGLGYVLGVSIEDIYTMPLSRFSENITVALAGHVAVKLKMGEFWTGAQEDLRQVWGSVYQLASYGAFGFKPLEGITPLTEFSGVEKFLEASMEETELLLKKHDVALMAIIEALLEKETLTGEDVVEIIEAAEKEAVDV